MFCFLFWTDKNTHKTQIYTLWLFVNDLSMQKNAVRTENPPLSNRRRHSVSSLWAFHISTDCYVTSQLIKMILKDDYSDVH